VRTRANLRGRPCIRTRPETGGRGSICTARERVKDRRAARAEDDSGERAGRGTRRDGPPQAEAGDKRHEAAAGAGRRGRRDGATGQAAAQRRGTRKSDGKNGDRQREYAKPGPLPSNGFVKQERHGPPPWRTTPRAVTLRRQNGLCPKIRARPPDRHVPGGVRFQALGKTELAAGVRLRLPGCMLSERT
jgi:hypothetical protein